ncbi:MAG: NAD(P)/FAD-dependent oxidoreductase [Christensenellales bacterium]
MSMFDLVVIGTGAGLTVAQKAAEQGLRVAIVEKGKFGGTCLTRGCIPSKMLVYPADLLREAQRAHKVGLHYGPPRIDWDLISRNVWERIDLSRQIQEDFSRLEGVTLFLGEGRFTGPHDMSVRLNAGGEATLEGRQFLIAAGAHSGLPQAEGLLETGFLTSESFFGDQYPKTPYKRLAIVGGGIIAAEFAHIFSALGTQVSIIGRNKQLLPWEDAEISALVKWQFEDFGIRVLLDHEVTALARQGGDKRITARDRGTGEEITLAADEVLIATGVVPESAALDLGKAGVATDMKGWIKVDPYLQTSQPHIYALGDITGGFLFRHRANYEADLLLHNLFSTDQPKRQADYRATPWAVFTYPQIGHVGLTEAQVRQQGSPYYCGRYRYSYIASGMAMGYRDGDGDNGLVKLLLDEQLHILGVHIAGFQAAALVQPFTYLMNAGQPLKDREAGTLLPLLRSMVIHPTLSELAAWSVESIDWGQPLQHSVSAP